MVKDLSIVLLPPLLLAKRYVTKRVININQVIDILKDIAKKEGVTVIMVTHDEKLAKESDRIILISDGRLCDEE